MATTYQAIAEVTVGASGTASIDFTSIPQTFTDLVVKLSSRSASGTTGVGATLNSDTGSNYTARALEGDGATVYSNAATYSSLQMGSSNGGTDTTSNTFASSELYIPNYAGSNNKSASSDAVTENNATTAYATMRASLWSNTSAITSITLKNSNGNNFAQYSTATLYGIKNS